MDNADRAMGYVGGMSFVTFAADPKTIDAVERCLQRLTEAVVRIGEERMREVDPTLPVHAIRGLGNVLRHEYDGMDLRIIWKTVVDELPPFRDACARAMRGIE